MRYMWPRLNRDQDRRDELLDPFFQNSRRQLIEWGITPADPYCGGVRHFRGLTVHVLTRLFEEGFVDPTDRQNDAPSAGEYFDFLQKHQSFTVHGYVVEITRSDYRLTIEGMECANGEYDGFDLVDFMAFEEGADERKAFGDIRSWWD